MTTVSIAYEVSAVAVAAVRELLDDVTLRDPSWNGAEFRIERDDFTCVPDDDSAAAAALLRQIYGVIEAAGEAGCTATFEVTAGVITETIVAATHQEARDIFCRMAGYESETDMEETLGVESEVVAVKKS